MYHVQILNVLPHRFRYCLQYMVEDLHGKIKCFVCISSLFLARFKPFSSSSDVLTIVVKKSTPFQAYRY
jgi:hypothetical protein